MSFYFRNSRIPFVQAHNQTGNSCSTGKHFRKCLLPHIWQCWTKELCFIFYIFIYGHFWVGFQHNQEFRGVGSSPVCRIVWLFSFSWLDEIMLILYFILYLCQGDVFPHVGLLVRWFVNKIIPTLQDRLAHSLVEGCSMGNKSNHSILELFSIRGLFFNTAFLTFSQISQGIILCSWLNKSGTFRELICLSVSNLVELDWTEGDYGVPF